MIILSKDYPYSLPDSFKTVNGRLGKFFNELTVMKRPLIRAILDEVKNNKIKLMYSNEVQDPRILVPNRNGDVIQVNISDISNNLDRTLARGNINLASLYSYLIQAYGMLKWDDIKQNREFLKIALDTYWNIMLKALTPKGIAYFRNDQDKNKMKFLLYCYVINKSDTIIRDAPSFAEAAISTSGYVDDSLVPVFEKYKEYLTKAVSLDEFFTNVLCPEYKWVEQLEESKYIVHNTYRVFGPTAAMMIDDLKYFVPLCLDYVQVATPIIYKNYPSLNAVIKKTAYKVLFDTITE